MFGLILEQLHGIVYIGLKDRIILMTGDTLGSKTRAFISSIKNLLIEKPFNLDKLKKVVIDLQRVMEERP